MSRHLTPAQAAQAAAAGSSPALLIRSLQRVPGIARTHHWASRADSDAYTYTLYDEDEDMIYDAKVIAGVTPSGNVYATVQAAIDAGAKSIFVKAGSHAGFTADVPGLMIVGEGLPIWLGAGLGMSTVGARFTSTITLSARGVALEKLSVKTTSGNGFNVTAQEVFLTHCQALECAAHGIAFSGNTSQLPLLEGCAFRGNIGSGVSIDHNTDWAGRFIGCHIAQNGDSGVKFLNGSLKEAMFAGCYIDSNNPYGVNNTVNAVRVVLAGCCVMDNITAQVRGLIYPKAASHVISVTPTPEAPYTITAMTGPKSFRQGGNFFDGNILNSAGTVVETGD